RAAVAGDAADQPAGGGLAGGEARAAARLRRPRCHGAAARALADRPHRVVRRSAGVLRGDVLDRARASPARRAALPARLTRPLRGVQTSGRSHSQAATLAITQGTPIFNQSGAPDSASIAALATIIVEANHFARRGTAPWSRQRRIDGPCFGCSSSQVSRRGQPRLPAHAATSRNGTVGNTGSTVPSRAS